MFPRAKNGYSASLYIIKAAACVCIYVFEMFGHFRIAEKAEIFYSDRAYKKTIGKTEISVQGQSQGPLKVP